MAAGPVRFLVGAATAATPLLVRFVRRSRASHKGLLLVGALAVLLAGCGQKGPLYRPDEAPASQAGNQGAAAPSQIND